jgi:Big-like domain-containing protein
MSSKKQKLRLTSSLALLALAALGVACRGFFVNPVLSSITVQPANPSIETGTTNNTVQMTASGTNNDGSQAPHPSVSWSINDQSIATISSSGLVKSVNTGTATVTATANSNSSITGTQTVTVTVGCIQSIAISPPTATFTNGGTTTATFTAKATTCNGTVDITSFASWFSSNTNEVTVSGGVATATQTAGQDSPVIISASSGGITSTTNATITLSGF